ncbi:MAG: tetratricopeptide repeat protein [Planctomycetota bacterium]
MKLTCEACVAFEQAINLFVDHELPESENAALVRHLDACGGCRDYLDDLRELANLHRDMDSGADAAVTDLVDRHALFAAVTRRLVQDKREELVRLFYELGKAYVLLANETARSGRLHRTVSALTRPVDIRGVTADGRRLVREGEALAREQGDSGRETGSLFRRSRRHFSSSERAGSGALANGRRLLEEALALRPDFDEARLYLGFHHMVGGRFDRARIEFRRVYRDGRLPVHRMMALQFLGNVYDSATDYTRANECYEEVLGSGMLELEPRFMTALLNLAMNCTKIGLAAKSVQYFSDLVSRFPASVTQLRSTLVQKPEFSAALARQSELHETLRRKVPALFAA